MTDEGVEKRFDEIEKRVSNLTEMHRTIEHAIEGREGVLEILGDLSREIYGDPKRKEPGLLELVKAQVKREEIRDITIRNAKWLIGALGLSITGLAAALLNTLRGLP